MEEGRTFNCTPHDIHIIKQPHEWKDPKVPEVHCTFKSFNKQDIRCVSNTDPQRTVIPLLDDNNRIRLLLTSKAPSFDALVNIPTFQDDNGNPCPLKENDTIIVSMAVGNLVAKNPSLLPCRVVGPNTGPSQTVKIMGRDFVSGACRYGEDHPRKGEIMGCYDLVVYK